MSLNLDLPQSPSITVGFTPEQLIELQRIYDALRKIEAKLNAISP